MPGPAASPHDDRNLCPAAQHARSSRGGSSQFAREDAGYHKGLKPRQLQMIAIGGAIGTGLFLGAGGRLASAGPGLFMVYAFCGVFVFLILRALGELVLHRPSSGSFVSYAREFLGEKAAYVAGWMYFLNWAMTAIVDSTAIATYFHFWRAFDAIPQWLIALIALAMVLGVNMISVKVFGELEFWAALIKVVALVSFLVAGTIFLAGRYKIEGQSTGFSVIADHGGLLPTGMFPLVIVTSGVVFAYAAVELVGTAAGETADPAKIMPRAINSVIARIALFYVGSVFLLGCCFPTPPTRRRKPVRHVLLEHRLRRRGLHHEHRGADRRVLQPQRRAVLHRPDLAVDGDERQRPEVHLADVEKRRAVRRHLPDRRHRPVRCRAQCGHAREAFEIVLNIAAWASSRRGPRSWSARLRLYNRVKAGILRGRTSACRWPRTAATDAGFPGGVLVLMALDPEKGPWVIAALVAAVPALIGGWFLVRDRVTSAAGLGAPSAEVPEPAQE